MGKTATKFTALSALALATVAMTAGAGSARAEDWHDWSGPYLGLQGGYEWGNSSGLFSQTEGSDPSNTFAYDYNFSPRGLVGGGHAGYNFQFGHFVVGVEGDAEGAGLTGKQSVNAAQDPTLTAVIKTTSDFDASIRVRAGYAFNRILLYGTGGAAWADVRTSYDCSACNWDLSGASSGIRTGWTAGGGAEFAIDRRWSVGVEYRDSDFGTQNFHARGGSDGVGFNETDRNSLTTNAVRLGISFHFPPAPPPPPVVAAPPAPMPVATPAPTPAPVARTFIVFFDFDKYNLTPDARKVVEEAANAYKAGGSAKVTLAGYTDLSGSIPYNLRLSERRAKTVAAYMSKQGVPASAMDVSWHGKENPRVPTPDGVREPQNRRVEISE